MQFTATDSQGSEPVLSAPYFEDARSDIAPYYSSRSTLEKIQKEIMEIIDKLGGRSVRLSEGFFGESPRRYGYVITFKYGDHDARIYSAGLPMRKPTADKTRQVKVQALLIVRDQLKAALTALVFSPGSYPLSSYVLLEGGEITVGEAITRNQQIPALPDPNEKIVITKE